MAGGVCKSLCCNPCSPNREKTIEDHTKLRFGSDGRCNIWTTLIIKLMILDICAFAHLNMFSSDLELDVSFKDFVEFTAFIYILDELSMVLIILIRLYISYSRDDLFLLPDSDTTCCNSPLCGISKCIIFFLAYSLTGYIRRVSILIMIMYWFFVKEQIEDKSGSYNYYLKGMGGFLMVVVEFSLYRTPILAFEGLVGLIWVLSYFLLTFISYLFSSDNIDDSAANFQNYYDSNFNSDKIWTITTLAIIYFAIDVILQSVKCCVKLGGKKTENKNGGLDESSEHSFL